MADDDSVSNELPAAPPGGGGAKLIDLEHRLDRLERQVAAAGVAAKLTGLKHRLDRLERQVAAAERSSTESLRAGLDSLRLELMRDIDRTRSRLAVPDGELIELEAFRRTPEYVALFENPRPLVTVTVSTYNRADLLVERSLASLLRQDHDHLEIIVVDDGSTDDTQRRVRQIGDPRIVYARLVDHVLPPELGAGIEARNLGLAMATGDFVTHLDDDDEYVPDRIGKLVRFAQQERAEFVWHPFWWQETRDGDWTVNEAVEMEFAKVTTGSVLYVGWLKRYLWDLVSAQRYGEPDDWTLFRTLRDLGVVMKRHPDVLLRHHKEGLSPRWAESAPATSVE